MTWLEDLNRERRRSSRRVSSRGPKEALLKIANTELPCAVTNESANGLAIVVENPPSLWIDDLGQLQTDAGLFKVRVAYIVRLDPDEETDSEKPSACLFGLERLEMVGEGDISSIPQRPSTKNAGALARSSVAMCIVMVPLLLTSFLLVRSAWVAAQTISWSDQEASPAIPKESPPSANNIHNLVRDMPGAEAFLLPEVIDKLKLSVPQLTKLRQLSEATKQALREFDRDWRSENPWESAQKREMILAAARHEALGVLTEQQRQQWKSLTE